LPSDWTTNIGAGGVEAEIGRHAPVAAAEGQVQLTGGEEPTRLQRLHQPRPMANRAAAVEEVTLLQLIERRRDAMRHG
jgi:hypothetical protein